MAQHFWEQLTCKPPKQKQGVGAFPTSKTPGPAGWAGSGLCRQGRRHGREASAGQEKKIEKTVDTAARLGYNIPCQRRAGPAAAAIPMGICIVVVR